MNDQIETVILQFRALAEESDLLPNDRERVIRTTQIADEAIVALREMAPAPNLNIAEQIEFYKFTLPEVLAFRHAEILRYQLTNNLPATTKEIQVAWLMKESRAFEHFNRLNGFYYEYHKNGCCELDHLYFTRENRGVAAGVICQEADDDGMILPLTSLFAKFRAHGNVQQWLQKKAAEIDAPDHYSDRRSDDLRWTGDLINLVELIYGLHLTGQINHGNASMNELVRWAERQFGVKIGIIQRKFAEIQSRKRIAATKFIDQMQHSLQQKIEDLSA